MKRNDARIHKAIELMRGFLCMTLVKRVLCVILLAFEVDAATISQVLGLSSKSIKKYELMLDSEEYKLLTHMGAHNRVNDLDAYKEVIFKELDSGAYCTLREIAVMIEEKTGLKRSRNRIHVFLRKNGYKPLKVGFFPRKGGWGKATGIFSGNTYSFDGASEVG